jgi:hypothetical protein
MPAPARGAVVPIVAGVIAIVARRQCARDQAADDEPAEQASAPVGAATAATATVAAVARTVRVFLIG